MAIIPKLAKEIISYARNYLKIKVNKPVLGNNLGDVWNTGDTGTFSITVNNKGEMDVLDLHLHLVASEHGNIALPTTTPHYVKELTLPNAITVPAHTTRTAGAVLFKAANPTKDGHPEIVVTVHVQEYDLSWDHLLNDHTIHSSPPKGTAELIIYPK